MQKPIMAKTPLNFAYSPQMQLLYCEQRDKLSQWRARDVCAPFWRLYWNDRAGACLASATTRHPLEPSHFTLVAPNTILSASLTRPVGHFHAHFTVGLPFAMVQSYVHRFPAKPWLIGIMRRYYPRYKTPVTDTPWRAAAVMTLCWHALMTLPKHVLAVAHTEPRLTDLLHWWEAQDWRDLPNAGLAGHIGMEKTAFCRFFKRIMGQPPHIYGLHKRLDRASIMLRFSSTSIKEIAEATGFCDRYHFSRVFKRTHKLGPSAFRRLTG